MTAENCIALQSRRLCGMDSEVVVRLLSIQSSDITFRCTNSAKHFVNMLLVGY